MKELIFNVITYIDFDDIKKISYTNLINAKYQVKYTDSNNFIYKNKNTILKKN